MSLEEGSIGGTVFQSPVTVWFDGACPLCRREIAILRRLDRRRAVEFVDVSPPGALPACPLDRDQLLRRFHAREGQALLSGAAAFAAVWRAIPILRPFGLAARHPRVLATLERLYGLFLRGRPSLQRLIRRFELLAGTSPERR